MTRTHLTALTMLLVATAGLPIGAQAPTPTTPQADSAAPDTTAPKKKGRFGGFMDKAKAVAGNKTVQGAAKGVACTVVPGAAAVTAATGQGPCVNSGLMGGLMSGNLKSAAGAAAGGAAGTVASGAAAKVLGKGGVAGAALSGALGGMGGLGGMSGMSTVAAQAAAMRVMMGAGANGLSNAAATATAMQMLQAQGMSDAAAAAAMTKMIVQSQGLSNAAAAAAMANMMQSGGAAAMSPADAAAAMKMLQNMGIAAAGNGAVATGTAAKPASAPAAAPATLWVNYDFVPGERVIYYADFTDDQVGNFPSRLKFVEGNMEVAELGGRRVLRATSQGALTIPLTEALPQRFTIEIDVINRPSLAGADFHLRGSVGRMDDPKTSVISWGSDGVSLRGGGGGQVNLVSGDATRLRYTGKPAQVRILGDGNYIKVYLDEKRMANVPNASFERSNVLHLFVDARSEENPAYIGRIRVAESRKSLYDDLAANGHVATQGLLFDTGSDRLRPESAPTLRQIAAMLEQHPELRLRIEGHTDNVGVKTANQTLSDKRAAAVKATLVADYHVNAGRLEAKGFGDTKPAGTNATAEGRSNNRRVELVKM